MHELIGSVQYLITNCVSLSLHLVIVQWQIQGGGGGGGGGIPWLPWKPPSPAPLQYFIYRWQLVACMCAKTTQKVKIH